MRCITDLPTDALEVARESAETASRLSWMTRPCPRLLREFRGDLNRQKAERVELRASIGTA